MKLKINSNVYGHEEVRVIMNLQTKPEGMTLDEIKELFYTINFSDSTPKAGDSGWSYSLNSLVQDGAIAIDNNIVKLNDGVVITTENDIVNVKLNQEK